MDGRFCCGTKPGENPSSADVTEATAAATATSAAEAAPSSSAAVVAPGEWAFESAPSSPWADPGFKYSHTVGANSHTSKLRSFATGMGFRCHHAGKYKAHELQT